MIRDRAGLNKTEAQGRQRLQGNAILIKSRGKADGI